MDKIVFDYKKRILKGFGIKRLSDYALNQASKIADFDFQKVKPIESVKKIEQPILMVHGDADKNISSEYGEELFKNLKSADKEFLLIEGGGHFDLFEKGGAKYKMKINNFIQRNLKSN